MAVEKKRAVLSVKDVDAVPSVQLDGVELAHLIARDGLSIEYDGGPGRSVPVVTITFGPGALEVEFLADLARAHREATS